MHLNIRETHLFHHKCSIIILSIIIITSVQNLYNHAVYVNTIGNDIGLVAMTLV